LAKTEAKIAALIAQGKGTPDVFQSIEEAMKCHADVVKIHPFQDGNGRSTRALMSVILVRCGLRPIPIETPRQEYENALNQYYDDGNSDELVSLAYQLYPW
jgi:Fic family protein